MLNNRSWSLQDAALGLLREEAVDAQSRRLHGEIILQQSVPLRIVTAAIAIIVIAMALWVATGRYARVEVAHGMLVPSGGYAKIYALHAGVVTGLMVRDGEEVTAGQKLATIKTEMPNSVGALGTQDDLTSIAAQATIAAQQIRLAGQRSRGEADRLTGVVAGLRRQASTISDQLDLQQQVVSSMAATFAQAAPVVERGYISKIDYERRRQALLTAKEDLSRLQQQKAANQADISRTEKEREQALLAGQNDQASARSALETLHQQRTRVEGEASYFIEAPVAGRVTTIQTGVGRSIEGSIPLMVIIPDRTPLRADLFLPSRAIGFVKRGQEVRLLYDAFPYQRFGSYSAHVDTISRLAIAGQETGAPFKIDEPVYRVTVRLEHQKVQAYGERVALQPGMTLVANLILERQSFLDWILDPLRAVSDRT